MSTPDPKLTTDGGPISDDAPDDQGEPAVPQAEDAEPSPAEQAQAQPPYPT